MQNLEREKTADGVVAMFSISSSNINLKLWISHAAWKAIDDAKSPALYVVAQDVVN